MKRRATTSAKLENIVRTKKEKMDVKKVKKIAAKTLTSKVALMVYSVFISILVWVIVSISIYPTAPRTISGVKLDAITLSNPASKLSPITAVLKEFDVQIKGNRTQVGSIRADELTVRAVTDEVTKADEYTLRLVVDNHSGIAFETLKIQPATITVSFDEIIEKRFSVTAEAPNISVAQSGVDMFIDSIKLSPETVTIKGPAKQINAINTCVVTVDDKGQFSESISTHSSKLTLYTADNAVLNQSGLTVPQTDFAVNISILTKKTLSLDFELKNAPTYLDIAKVKSNFNLSSKEITIAAPNDSINNFSQSLGYIDLRDVKPGYVKVFNLELPESFKNISNITTVVATFNSEDYAEKSIIVKRENFSFVNIPLGYGVKIDDISKTLHLIGSEETLDKITVEDITLEIDLSNEKLRNLTFNKTFKVIIEKYPGCWASFTEEDDNMVTITAVKQATV
ncbi:hypothetical protein FACS1894132_14100 [Clostridia bacterium]|nr:hypothetical protein FACS1894132_14100 [Clostridia bacterium]